MAKITFIGDIHGQYQALEHAWKNNDSDLFIQVGDFGMDYSSLPSGKPTLFIDGNHEHFPSLKPGHMGGSIWHMPRASRLMYEGTSINFFGGAESIDRAYRTEGVDWFPEELPTYGEQMRLLDLPPCDILVTHTGPYTAIRKMGLPFNHWTRFELDLEKMMSSMARLPRLWVFGHFHPINVKIVDYRGVTFVCLPINKTYTIET